MSDFFQPYEGKKPYAFVSYSHRNSDRVLDIISPLHGQKYRVWYDEGIPAGSDWPKNIEIHLHAASAVLFFISAFSLESVNCFNEIKEAVAKNKAILCLRLDDSILPPEWEAMIGNAPKLDAIIDSGETIAGKILAQGTITPAFLGDGTNDKSRDNKWLKFNLWMVAAAFCALLVLATLLGTYGLANHWFDEYLLINQKNESAFAVATPIITPAPLPTIDPSSAIARSIANYASFPDVLQERAIRDALGQQQGDILSADLLKITELHFCGNMAPRSADGIAFDQAGACYVNGAPVIQGEISDLELIKDMLALERLSLVCQQISRLDNLAPLSRLIELNVAGNPIDTIGEIGGMVSLQILHLEHTSVRDLTALNTLPKLKTVTVNADMFPLKFDANTQKYDVVLVP